MISVIGSGEALGATVEGLDLSQPLSAHETETVMRALGEHGVLRFADQTLTAAELKAFSASFGELEINVANAFQAPGLPEVMILSNIKQDGKPIGMQDAGQSWHTDMSYSRMIAFANVLYGVKIPRRNGVALGSTAFCNMHAAYRELPRELKTRLDGMTATHDFAKFWDMMRNERGSTRPPLTEAQRQAKPPVSHPIFLTHPITGRKVLYANPGYTVRIDGMAEDESDEILAFLFEHQVQDRFRYSFSWSENDVLMWENFGTIHNAIPDYGPDEHRLIQRCQVTASRFFEDGVRRGSDDETRPRVA